MGSRWKRSLQYQQITPQWPMTMVLMTCVFALIAPTKFGTPVQMHGLGPHRIMDRAPQLCQRILVFPMFLTCFVWIAEPYLSCFPFKHASWWFFQENDQSANVVPFFISGEQFNKKNCPCWCHPLSVWFQNQRVDFWIIFVILKWCI